MVFQLLAFCRGMSKYSPATHDEVRACIYKRFIDHKIFLLPAERCRYLTYVLIKEVANINCGFIKRCYRFQQRRFVIERFFILLMADGDLVKDWHFSS
jgi:hypothetical protein